MPIVAIDAPVPGTCVGCVYEGGGCLLLDRERCTPSGREDGRDVIFVEQEDKDAARYRWIMAHCDVLLQNGKIVEDEAQPDRVAELECRLRESEARAAVAAEREACAALCDRIAFSYPGGERCAALIRARK